MTDERIRAAQSMLKNPIGSYVPLWDLTHKCGIDANAHRPSQKRFESRGESQLMTFDLESGGDARSLDSPAKSDLDGVMWKEKTTD
jgi:hypothetical protein